MGGTGCPARRTLVRGFCPVFRARRMAVGGSALQACGLAGAARDGGYMLGNGVDAARRACSAGAGSAADGDARRREHIEGESHGTPQHMDSAILMSRKPTAKRSLSLLSCCFCLLSLGLQVHATRTGKSRSKSARTARIIGIALSYTVDFCLASLNSFLPVNREIESWI